MEQNSLDSRNLTYLGLSQQDYLLPRESKMTKKKVSGEKKTSVPPAKASDVYAYLKKNDWNFLPADAEKKTIIVEGKEKKLYPALVTDISVFLDSKTKSLVEKAFAAIKFGGKKKAYGKEHYRGEFKPGEGVRAAKAGTLTIPVATFFGMERKKDANGKSVYEDFSCSVNYNEDNTITIKFMKRT